MKFYYENEILTLEENCYKQILSYFCSNKYEQGGLIGVNSDLYHITNFYADKTGISSDCHFTPNEKELNEQIKIWSEKGICFCGIIHSHINGCLQLSENDKKYIILQLNRFNHMPFLWFPIISSNSKEITFFNCKLENNQLIFKKYTA